MKRRNFLGSLLTIPVAAKTILSKDLSNVEKEEKIEATNEIVKINFIDKNDKKLTKEFFNYLKSHKVKFDWKKINNEMVVYEEKPYIVKSRKLDIIIDSSYPSGFACKTITSKSKNEELVFKSIIGELEREFEFTKLKKFFIYKLNFTPTIYNPKTFKPNRGIMISYIRIYK